MHVDSVIRATPAPWEKRNLGLEAVEIDVLSPAAPLDCILSAGAGYELATVKIPSGSLHLVHGLESEGFRFVETQFSIGVGLSPLPALSSIQSAILRKYRLQTVLADEVPLLQELIEEGLFKTDRIALDPAFGNRCANRRYSFWVADMAIQRLGSLQWLCTVGEPVQRAGFVVIQEDGAIVHALLGGVLPRFQILGAGLAMVLRPLHDFAAKGFAQYMTKISSNNVPVLRLYQAAGFQVHAVDYVLRRLEPRKA